MNVPTTSRIFGDADAHLLREGTHARLYQSLGGHLNSASEGGARFAVWAPNAASVSVIGEWNGWQGDADPLRPRADSTGVWEGHCAGAHHGAAYKYRILTRNGQVLEKADPLARYSEEAPATASRLWSLDYEWQDAHWMESRAPCNALDAPISIYELHLGSWRRHDNEMPNYREVAPQLADYLADMGFTHVELMPITEHPFYGSWGYQTTGYFAPTSRYGTPQDFMHFVDVLHQRGIGVLLDWVPSHFPTDAHGLAEFDGTHLYEHGDPRQGFHPEWNTAIFNYGRNEVRSFLVSSAIFWLDKYHIDGLRVDAVASMLYLDYARKEGEWIPNQWGGRENLEAIDFLHELNRAVYREYPDTSTAAEESTAWPMVSRPIEMGGLGFGLKWNMGWMHDTLAYMKEDPIHRRYHHHKLTFSAVYAFTENFVLPLSHDEVVYGKGSLINKMPGDEWQQFANLRAMLGYMWAHPGKKLLFMGGEFAQRREWTHEGQLEWWVCDTPGHGGVQHMLRELNRVYRAEASLYELDFVSQGFEWVEANDEALSVFAFLRRARSGAPLLVVCNLTPVPRPSYLLGVPQGGIWRELFNTDAREYGGSGWGERAERGEVEAAPVRAHGHAQSLSVDLPPLSTLILKGPSHG
ncbi:MAG: 1,4-alpha-glucan branching protein GlgB [Burkholderiaceae bacterium]|jgi:1,4-alpha-glucan branching enzyme|nr:1,4-alpha-glucan branching protein GlgB [Burkholderiaceae bacterium]